MRVCRTRAEVTAAAAEILPMSIGGRPVEAVLVEQGVAIAHEAYLAIVLSRHHRAPLLVFAAEGGVDVEQLARTRPEAVLKLPVDPLLGLCDYQARDVAAAAVAAAGLARARRSRAGRRRGGDGEAARRRGARPLATVPRARRDARRGQPARRHRRPGTSSASTARSTVDDNALWRQPDLAPLGPGARRARASALARPA